MRVIHNAGFAKSELEKFVDVLRDNCLAGMMRLLFACSEWSIEIPENLKSQADAIMNATELTEEIALAIQDLWITEVVQKAFQRSNEIQLPGGSSGTAYYVEHAVRFSKPEYLPTQDDVIRAKLRTTGITEVTFNVGQTEFTMTDVGGQRSERRKWLNCFVDITAVIFLVAINEFDMNLEEDNKTNRMEESLKLFQKLTGAQWFQNVSFILFLNKSDLFIEKIKKNSLREYFEDYDAFLNEQKERKSMSEFECSCEYISKQYKDAFNGHSLYSFVTCAIDTKNCDRVFGAVRDMIVSRVVRSGF